MVGTKIFVVKLKDVIKAALFAFAGLVAVIILIVLFMPRGNKEQTLFEPGTYTASIILHSNPFYVDVTVTDKEIISISLENMNETHTMFYPTFSTVMADLASTIIKTQSTDISITNDYPVTQDILITAINSAVSKATKNI